MEQELKDMSKKYNLKISRVGVPHVMEYKLETCFGREYIFQTNSLDGELEIIKFIETLSQKERHHQEKLQLEKEKLQLEREKFEWEKKKL